jgi:hypothetical protein
MVSGTSILTLSAIAAFLGCDGGVGLPVISLMGTLLSMASATSLQLHSSISLPLGARPTFYVCYLNELF